MEDEDHLRHTCRYVVLNPVRAGLCDAAADWPWSWCREDAIDGRITARKRR